MALGRSSHASLRSTPVNLYTCIPNNLKITVLTHAITVSQDNIQMLHQHDIRLLSNSVVLVQGSEFYLVLFR